MKKKKTQKKIQKKTQKKINLDEDTSELMEIHSFDNIVKGLVALTLKQEEEKLTKENDDAL